MRCTIHGNDLSCPGAGACDGFLNVAPELLAADPAPLVEVEAPRVASALERAVDAIGDLGTALDELREGANEEPRGTQAGHLPHLADSAVLDVALSAAHTIAACVREMNRREREAAPE